MGLEAGARRTRGVALVGVWGSEGLGRVDSNREIGSINMCEMHYMVVIEKRDTSESSARNQSFDCGRVALLYSLVLP